MSNAAMEWHAEFILRPACKHINEHGYNRDRGPVVVPTFRSREF